MRNEDQWLPTKFIQRNGRWRTSRDPKQVSRGSRLVTDRVATAYAAALSAHARGDLLDVGCGEVPLYGIYRSLVSSITCVDWGNSPHLDHEVDLRESLPFDDQTFDTIVATDVLEHMPYPDRLFAEMRRLVRPGGKIILGVPFYYWLHAQPHDYHRYTEYRLRLFCDDHDLTVVDCHAYGRGMDVLVDVLSKMLAARRPTQLVAGWPAAVGRWRFKDPASQQTTAMPLGYTLVAEAPR